MKRQYKINKIYGILLLMISSTFFATTYGTQTNVGQSLSNFTNTQIFGWSCDSTLSSEIYDGHRGLFTWNFENTSNNNLYLRQTRTEANSDNQYIYFNSSIYNTVQSPIVMNFPLLQDQIDRTVAPGKKYRHLTTADEIGGSFVHGEWPLSSPITLSNYSAGGSTQFNNANFRAQGHPDTPNTGNEYDTQVRILTLYDTDNVDGGSNNYINVGCYNIQVRRCGDGIYDSDNEPCDPLDPNQEGWTDGACSCENTVAGFCGDGIVDPGLEIVLPDDLPPAIAQQVTAALAPGQTEECDSGWLGMDSGDGNGLDGLCDFNCLEIPEINPEITWEG